MFVVIFSFFDVDTALAQQVFTQLECRVVIEREDNIIKAAGVIQSNQPTRADYTLRTLKIDAAGSGTSEQSGSLTLEPGETGITSQVTYRLATTGWIEFHLRVTERLTGTSCEAEEIISPM
ncbi:curli-like amyloid fiber formation chaperone CsgH [Onishia taeanensis]